MPPRKIVSTTFASSDDFPERKNTFLYTCSFVDCASNTASNAYSFVFTGIAGVFDAILTAFRSASVSRCVTCSGRFPVVFFTTLDPFVFFDLDDDDDDDARVR